MHKDFTARRDGHAATRMKRLSRLAFPPQLNAARSHLAFTPPQRA
jgi:hypothetical protein